MYGNNFYPPYMGMGPNMMSRGIGGGIGNLFRANTMRNIGTGTGLFSKLRGGINLGSVLTNTQKTLNVINQAIPVVKQTGPMFNNMKTMFKLASAFKDTTSTKESNTKTNKKVENNKQEKNENISKEQIQEKKINNDPYFFI